MKKRIVLMANDVPGVEVCKYLIANGDQLVRLYLHEPDKQKNGQEIIAASNCSDIYFSPVLKERDHIAGLQALEPHYIITVYWAYLLSEQVIDSATEGTVNFHPALLPINRGWYPHVHSILDGSPTGVTLHLIDKTADTGAIWAQKEVPLTPYDTAFEIYRRLQREIVKLFVDSWPKIVSGELTPIPQEESKAVYHKKSEVDDLDRLDLEPYMKVEKLVDILRARSFGNKGFAYFDKDGQRVFVNIRLSHTTSFE